MCKGGGIELPQLADMDVHGTKRIRPNQEDTNATQTVPKQRKNRGTRRRRGKDAIPSDNNALSKDPVDDVDSTVHVDPPVAPDGAEEPNPQESIDIEEMELEAEDDEDDEEGEAPEEENVEGQPREPTAAMKKKLKRMAQQLSRDAGHVIMTLGVDDLVPSPQMVNWNEEDHKLLCSYNWQGANDGTNTIFVPGSPAKFNDSKTLPQFLDTDQGYHARDYNYVRKPRDPFSPLFTALGVMSPGYQFFGVDVLADRNNLRVLLEFAQGKSNGPFRLDVHMVYNTLVFVRKGERFWMRQNGEGIGSNFEKMFTDVTNDMEDATGHYRAIRYAMGPLEVVVRFEVDAYFDENISDELTPGEVDAAQGALLAEKPNFNFRPPIKCLQKGQIIPMAQMAELKTTTYKHYFEKVQCADQLWFGRTPHLFTGIYKVDGKKGQVVHIKYENAKERVKIWEERNQDALRKLVDLLTRIRVALKKQDGPVRAGVLVRESRDSPLVLRTMLRKSHIVSSHEFATHWDRSQNVRNYRTASRPFQPRFHNGMRGHSGQLGAMRSHEHQPSRGNHRGHGAQQPGSYGRGNFGSHGTYGGGNNIAQQQPGSHEGSHYPPRGGYGGQQQPGNIRGGRGSGRSRGHHEGRGRGRGRGYDANYGANPGANL